MSRVADTLVTALLGTILFITPSSADSALEPTITLRVHDYVGLRLETLDEAQCEVRVLFATAGMALRWTDPVRWSDDTRAQPLWRRVEDITVIALSPRMARRKGLPFDALGSAVVAPQFTGRVVYVVVKRIERVAAAAGQRSSDMLALVIAHEIGHLLQFGHDMQSAGSVMRTAWTLRELRRFDIRAARSPPIRRRRFERPF
jgi:hypothetical protein